MFSQTEHISMMWFHVWSTSSWALCRSLWRVWWQC